jgi:hypothetical protein
MKTVMDSVTRKCSQARQGSSTNISTRVTEGRASLAQLVQTNSDDGFSRVDPLVLRNICVYLSRYGLFLFNLTHILRHVAARFPCLNAQSFQMINRKLLNEFMEASCHIPYCTQEAKSSNISEELVAELGFLKLLEWQIESIVNCSGVNHTSMHHCDAFTMKDVASQTEPHINIWLFLFFISLIGVLLAVALR